MQTHTQALPPNNILKKNFVTVACIGMGKIIKK
jgi:hypothetical protein